MNRAVLLALLLGLAAGARAADAPAPTPSESAWHLSRFGAGAGPSAKGGVLRLLDEARTPLQANAVAFDREREGAFEALRLEAKVRVLEGGDGGSFAFLSTAEYGARGAAPYLPSAVEPNLRGTFAVGLDVHNPPSEEMFTPWGNYQDLPQREVSLHWDGREVVKRVAPAEFRGREADLRVAVDFVAGGAEVSVEIAGASVYDREFVAGMAPYEGRLAVAAGTRADATTLFDVSGLSLRLDRPASPRRPPVRVEVFHHVRTDNARTAFAAEVSLPPASWAFERVLATLDLHDAGLAWDEWDRCGEVSVWADDGTKLGILPFITSYRTPCHWVVDLTAFRPLLAGRRRLEIAAGTTFYKNRGYLMSLALEYHHGAPALAPYRVVPLWHGTARHGAADNHFRDFFEPRAVAVEAEAKAARLFVTTTGHSQVGEFTPARRTVVVAPRRGGDAAEARRFEHLLWKTDCYLNPNRPQFGTWQFSRAGWAPGDWVRPWWVDITGVVVPGAEAEFRYEPQPYEFPAGARPPSPAQVAEATHNIRAYLVLWRDATGLVPAPSARVVDVKAGGSASQAGMREGDWLAAYDGKTVGAATDLRAAVEAAKAAGKERIPVVVWREGERIELTVGAGLLGIQLASP